MVKTIFILLFFAVNNLAAQDLIVKRSGESIYCNIESVEDYYIYFYELGDTSRQLLYKMDAALVKKIAFAGDDLIPALDEKAITNDKSLNKSYMIVESNVDGIFNDYLSLHFQYLNPKWALDVGFKRYSAPSNLFFQTVDDNGSMFELGISLPMKMFGTENTPLRGLYLRGFAIYTSGDFQNSFQFDRLIEYNQFSFGIQGVLIYQIDKRFSIKTYYGLGGTIQVGSFGPPSRRADLSGSDGLQSIYGLRVGYIF